MKGNKEHWTFQPLCPCLVMLTIGCCDPVASGEKRLEETWLAPGDDDEGLQFSSCIQTSPTPTASIIAIRYAQHYLKH